MTYDRQYVEAKGRFGSGIQGQTGLWYLCNVLGNIPIYCHKQDRSVTPSLTNDGFWEAWITAWVLNNIDDQTLFVDVGAHTGYYSVIAKSKGAKVMAFEPNPKYIEMLRATSHIGFEQSRGNWLPENHFNVYPYAVSNEVGETTLTIPNELTGSASIRENAINEDIYPSEKIKVLTTTLNHSLAAIKTDKMLIKIDAEGAEEMIWDGANEIIQIYKPTIILEYTPGAYGRDFLTKVEAYGDLMWINHAGKEEPISKDTIIAHTDWLMLVIKPRN